MCLLSTSFCLGVYLFIEIRRDQAMKLSSAIILDLLCRQQGNYEAVHGLVTIDKPSNRTDFLFTQPA